MKLIKKNDKESDLTMTKKEALEMICNLALAVNTEERFKFFVNPIGEVRFEVNDHFNHMHLYQLNLMAKNSPVKNLKFKVSIIAVTTSEALGIIACLADDINQNGKNGFQVGDSEFALTFKLES